MTAFTRLTFGLTILGCCWAGTTTVASGSVPAGVTQAAAVETTTDPATGLKVRLTRQASGSLLVEVADDLVSIKKTIGPSGSLTTLVVPGETLTVAFTLGHLTVTGRHGSFRVDGTTPDGARRLVAYLKQSTAVQAARVLLGRLELRRESVAGRSLWLTRTLLDSAAGRVVEMAAQVLSMSPRRSAVALPVRYGVTSSNSCWDSYQREAESMITELRTCLNEAAWWNTVEQGVCGAIYAIEAETAFAEYLMCSARLLGPS